MKTEIADRLFGKKAVGTHGKKVGDFKKGVKNGIGRIRTSCDF